jgi:8-oxo-dGTP pyrophosphatase MutT (NUDIX family)
VPEQRLSILEDPPPSIPAVTVVLVRSGVDGVETLMLRRNPRIGFGNMWVFPGGRIEPGDGGPSNNARAAAVREMAEETGIKSNPSELIIFARWSPPPVILKRFDTLFFVAQARDEEVVVDGGEILSYEWTRPTDFLLRHAAGDVELAPPTWVTLHNLGNAGTVANVLSDARTAPVESFVTHFVKVNEEQSVALWDGDVAYDHGPVDAVGGRHRLTMVAGAWHYERTGITS